MLDECYSTQFYELTSSIDWDIELPIEWKDYFKDRGGMAIFADDERSHQRLKVRTHGVLWFDRTLSFFPRSKDPMGVYTRDFSSKGVGFLSPIEIFPEEQVRLVLPTFWVQLGVVRARRINSKCYEIGARLIRRHDPGPEAFPSSCLSAPTPL